MAAAAEADEASTVGISKLLAKFYLGSHRVSIRGLELTSIGRAQRQAGIVALKKHIESDGFDESYAPIVCLVNPLPQEQSLGTVLAAGDIKLRVIDGNHRVAALQQIDEETKPTSPRVISVRVHQPMPQATERMVAAGCNRISSNVVKTLLVDEVVWYRSVIHALQEQHQGSTAMTNDQILKAIKKDFANQSQKAPANQTLKKWIGIALNITPYGLEALRDLSYLPGREPNHPDLTSLDYKRVTLKLVERTKFQGMNKWQQEAYVYRLAKGAITTNKQLNDEQCKTLDSTAETIAQEIERVESIIPRAEWSEGFKRGMRKVMIGGLQSRYYGHLIGLQTNVEAYKKTLPEKMEVSKDHINMLLREPHASTLLQDDPEMKPKWEAYAKGKKDIEQTSVSDKADFVQKGKAPAADAGSGSKQGKGKGPTTTPAAAADAPAATSSATSTSSAGPSSDPPTSSGGSSGTKDSAAATTGGASTNTGDKGNMEKEVPVVPAKRKRAAPAPTIAPSTSTANDERSAKLEKKVAQVQIVDPLSSVWNVSTNPLLEDDGSIMLAFLNVAGDRSILDDSADGKVRLVRALTEIAGTLDDRGSLAIAMESTVSFNYKHMTDSLKEAGLALEAFPVTSVYLNKLAGRTPTDSKQRKYTRQTASVLVAHKTGEHTSHASGPQFDPPRISQLEAVGIIISQKHPSATFLAPSMADHLLNRFTSAGDKVLVSAFEDNNLASLVLTSGRRLFALVGDPAKAVSVGRQVKSALATAMTAGWFKALANAGVPLGGSVLPAGFPSHNMSQASQVDIENIRHGYDEDDDGSGPGGWNLEFAKRTAAEFGLEIRDATKGGGLWTIQDQEIMPMFGQGQYELLTSDQLLAAVENDGKPRYVVCGTELLAALVVDGQYDAGSGLLLVLRLDPSCFLYYMNACDAGDSKENIERRDLFGTKSPNQETAPGLLADAENGLSFSMTSPVTAGTELLHYFPSRASVKRARIGVEAEGGAGASPSGRRTLFICSVKLECTEIN
ncbi:unnamed protein product [Ectocarpus sp. CCAP 1310/34]|nr:unnamed protein product [Ectocarpus sp. CCAP 1310/34]